MLHNCSNLTDAGKLGHGDTSRVYKPRVIESLSGTHVRKVVCSGQSSIALASNGQVSYCYYYHYCYCITLKRRPTYGPALSCLLRPHCKFPDRTMIIIMNLLLPFLVA